MTIEISSTVHHTALRKQLPAAPFDQEFMDDVVDLFFDFRSGQMSKHSYKNHGASGRGVTFSGSHLWRQISTDQKADYYVTRTDRELFVKALPEISSLVTGQPPLIDLGSGTLENMQDFAAPLVKAMQSKLYVPVDISTDLLQQADGLNALGPGCQIVPRHLDFFAPVKRPLVEGSAFAALTGATIGNIPGGISTETTEERLTRTLRNLAVLCNCGWLLISVDGNQDATWLQRMYNTPQIAAFVLNALYRIADELPVQDYDPTLFAYDPTWYPEHHLFAHEAVATQDQNFSLGPYEISILKGDRFHLKNSYKYPPAFFEGCAKRAGFDVVAKWSHENPMTLYLLKYAQ